MTGFDRAPVSRHHGGMRAVCLWAVIVCGALPAWAQKQPAAPHVFAPTALEGQAAGPRFRQAPRPPRPHRRRLIETRKSFAAKIHRSAHRL